jgi:hypothetical protein
MIDAVLTVFFITAAIIIMIVGLMILFRGPE